MFDVEPGVVALTVRHREPGKPGVDAADDLPGLLHLVEGRPARAARLKPIATATIPSTAAHRAIFIACPRP